MRIPTLFLPVLFIGASYAGNILERHEDTTPVVSGPLDPSTTVRITITSYITSWVTAQTVHASSFGSAAPISIPASLSSTAGNQHAPVSETRTLSRPLVPSESKNRASRTRKPKHGHVSRPSPKSHGPFSGGFTWPAAGTGIGTGTGQLSKTSSAHNATAKPSRSKTKAADSDISTTYAYLTSHNPPSSPSTIPFTTKPSIPNMPIPTLTTLPGKSGPKTASGTGLASTTCPHSTMRHHVPGMSLPDKPPSHMDSPGPKNPDGSSKFRQAMIDDWREPKATTTVLDRSKADVAPWTKMKGENENGGMWAGGQKRTNGSRARVRLPRWWAEAVA